MMKITRTLQNKSIDSFLLALELFNKPTIEYRSESFAILFTNAWELLMKAYLYHQSAGRKDSIFRKKQRHQKRETITLDECINKLFPNEHELIRRNIEYIAELRNSASHLYIGELDPYLTRVYQSGIFNYLNQINAWFGKNLESKLKPGLLAIISADDVPKIATLKSRFNREDFESINDFINKYKELEKNGVLGAISLNYRLALTKTPKNADLVIGVVKGGIEKAMIVEKPKDVDLTHPFVTNKTIEEVKKRIDKSLRFTRYTLQAYCFVSGVRKTEKNEYYWKSTNSQTGTYSQLLVDTIVNAINANSDVIKKWTKGYQAHLSNHRKTRQD